MLLLPIVISSPLLCLESHPPLLVHPWSVSVPPSSLCMAQALIFAEFLQRPQVSPPHLVGGARSAHLFCSSFPMQVSTSLSVPVPRRGSHRPNPRRGPKYPAAPHQASSSLHWYAIWVRAPNTPSAREHPRRVLRPSLYTLQAAPGKFKQRCSVSLLY